MSTAEVTLATGICRQTVYKHLHRGDLPGTWNGKRWSITPAAVIRWAGEEWERGRCLMYDPNRVKRVIEFVKEEPPRKRKS